jgi:V/A-type H+-transporting ATPase subunit E
MSLDSILQSLEVEVERQIAEIEQTTQAEIERIRAWAQAEAEAVRQKRLVAIQVPLQAEQARILNQAKLKALQIVLGTRENLMTAVLEATAQRLAALSNLEVYTQLMQKLFQEAVDTLGVSDQLRLHVQRQDMELMGQIVQEMGLNTSVEGDLKNEGTWNAELGGVVATSLDGRISVVNTLEMRLNRVAKLYRSQIAGLVFDQVEDR